MACGVGCSRLFATKFQGGATNPQPSARAAAYASVQANLRRPEFELAGTWDFKWPLCTTIRVAFQSLRGAGYDDFDEAKRLVQALAGRWQPPGQIRFNFDGVDLEPPLGSAVASAHSHRSAFQPEEPKRRPYDVLVSMEDLPLHVDDPLRGPGQERSTIRFPVSELGSYARRGDYGVPTIYIGRFGNSLAQSLVSYLGTDIGKHVVVHEFGHVLGLPHVHQHPGLIRPSAEVTNDVKARDEQRDATRAAFYRPVEELQLRLDELLGVFGEKEEVQNHITRVWRGNEAYSDWTHLEPKELTDHQERAQLDSVMTLPYYPLLTNVNAVPGTVPLVTAPGELDKRMLRRMYDQEYQDGK